MDYSKVIPLMEYIAKKYYKINKNEGYDGKKENLKEEVVNEQPKVEKKKTKSKKDIELDALREENEEMKKELEELTEKH